MPANLPPQYLETEKKLKSAVTSEEKIKVIEELLSIIPKHKGTEKIQAQLKTKMAKLRSDTKKKPTTAHQGPSHGIKRSGAGQAIMVGPPNSGKSKLTQKLTGADILVGDYPFTTSSATPAMMPYEDIQIQLVDTPPLTPDYMESWIPDLIRTSDGILVVLDLTIPESGQILVSLINKLKEKKILFLDQNQQQNQTHQFFLKKAVLVANKKDAVDTGASSFHIPDFLSATIPFHPVSAKTGLGLPELKKSIFQMLDIIRVYSKTPGGKAELDSPFTLKKGSTVLDMARAVHKDFSLKLKFARIWGNDTYNGQKVKRDHVLEDGDLIELHI